MANSFFFVCRVCKRRLLRADLETHLAESHSNPTKRNFTVNGEEQLMDEAEYIRATIDSRDEASEDQTPDNTVAPAPSIFDELGIKFDDFAGVDVTTMTGAVLTDREAKLMLEAVQDYVGFQIHRPAFIANLLDWGIRNSFTEELAEAGGFDVVTDPTQPPQTKYVKVEDLHHHVVDFFSTRQYGRSFTFRRFGRFLGKEIPKICAKVPKLAKYSVDGSPMSNRLGIPPQNFLCATSIFEYIKPFSKWSPEEKRAWEAHNRSVRKRPREQDTSFVPQDLRPAPSEAETMVEHNTSDFARRHRQSGLPTSDYGKGLEIFEKMWSEKPKTDRNGLGHGV